MTKIWIVLRSEFVRRVTSKWFIATTVLAPVVLLALMVLPPVVGMMASENNEWTVAVVDETDVLGTRLAERDAPRFTFVPVDTPADSVRAAVLSGRFDGYLVLRDGMLEGDAGAAYYSVDGGGFSLGRRLAELVNDEVTRYRLDAQDVPLDVRAIMEDRISVDLLKLTDGGSAPDSAAASSAIGLGMGFVIYFTMFLYGAYVMHGVMEEKQSRVLEVVVSSVRPFELLMGKVLGIGAMGLLQMATWIVFVVGLALSAGGIASVFLDPSDFNLPDTASAAELVDAANISFPHVAPDLVAWFLLFFLGGYLLYASLFAAIGSLVDNQQDAQGLMFPVTILIIIPLLFITVLIENPHSLLSVVLSMVPFFSPILMVVRLATTSVPFWQVLLSYTLLCAAFVLSIWICARIYRIGILMYGKKPTYRDLARWLRHS
ncbi:MAG: ABC transporter permease [Rhodothermales bacterium]